MVMLRVIPGKAATEVFLGLGVIQESPGIRRGAFDGAEGGFAEVGQTLSLTGLLLPANDAPGFDRQERTAVARRNALWLGGLNHGEDGQFGLRF